MKVTINGVIYEGTEEEIRRIVENPPNYGGDNINYPYPYPTNPGPYVPPTYPAWPPSYPTCQGNNDWPWERHNWDGSPIVTCCIDGDFIC